MSNNFLAGRSCLFFGQADCIYTQQCLDILDTYNLNVTAILSKGRGEHLPSEAGNWKGDFIFSYRNYWLLPSSILEAARQLAINFHPGTPAYPGSGSYSWVLYEGGKKFGITVHLMNEKIDNGKILKFYDFAINEELMLEDLIEKTKHFSVDIFKKYIDYINGCSAEDIKKLKTSMPTREWEGSARKIIDLEKMRALDLKMTEADMNRRIRSFNLKSYPVYLQLHGKKFYYENN
jgi:methionyl-tRNA formyltransferase